MVKEQTGLSAAFTKLRVIELSENVAGPLCAKMLAAIGAEVIKVERPGAGDPIRLVGPFPGDVPDPEKGGLYLFLNTGKKSITLDVSSPTGRELLLRLVTDADVLISSFTASQLERAGLGYDQLAQVNTRLVMVSVTPFGLTGPYAEYKAPEIVLRALSGEMYLAGEPDRPPLMKGGNLAQVHGGLHALIAVLSALNARESLGHGQHVDVSQAEGWASIGGMFLKSYTYRQKVPKRSGGSDSFPGGLRRCKDGWVIVSGRGGRRDSWTNFVGTVDLDVLREERFGTPEGRQANREALEQIFNEWLMSHSGQEIYHKAQSNGLAAAYVCDAEDLLGSPQFYTRQYYQEITDLPLSGIKFPSMPYHMGATMWRTTRAPRLGEHNEAVLCGQLGLMRQDLAVLRAQGLI